MYDRKESSLFDKGNQKLGRREAKEVKEGALKRNQSGLKSVLAMNDFLQRTRRGC